MVASKITEPTADQLLETLFLPQNLDNLRLQHQRYVRIQDAQGKKDEIGIIGYMNTVLMLGYRLSVIKLIDKENRLGLMQ